MSNGPIPAGSRNVVALKGERRLPSSSDLVQQAREALHEQANAIAALGDRLNERFAAAAEMVLATPGHLVVLGVGKSGHVGKKIAASLASTGTPSFFVHASEAVHGDLGMLTDRDTALLISRSGETEEVIRLLPHLRAMKIPTIALVGEMNSTLAREADVVLDATVDREICPNNLAPTSSTLAAMAMGDVLAVTLERRRGFMAADFAKFHPGGCLGRRLLGTVAEAMHTDIPTVAPTDTIGESLVTMTAGRLGLVIVMNGHKLVGLITDGDLRRGMQRHTDLLNLPVSEIMTQNPVTIGENATLTEAHERMQQMKLKALVVIGATGKVTGVVEVFDEK